MRKTKIAGLHLWEVKISYGSSLYRKDVCLWVTTTRDEMSDAFTKTKTFLGSRGNDYPMPNIISVSNKGTLDC